MVLDDPDMGTMNRLARGPLMVPLVLPPEQCIRRIAMRGGSQAMFFDPGDLSLQQGEPFLQLVLRIGA